MDIYTNLFTGSPSKKLEIAASGESLLELLSNWFGLREMTVYRSHFKHLYRR